MTQSDDSFASALVEAVDRELRQEEGVPAIERISSSLDDETAWIHIVFRSPRWTEPLDLELDPATLALVGLESDSTLSFRLCFRTSWLSQYEELPQAEIHRHDL